MAAAPFTPLRRVWRHIVVHLPMVLRCGLRLLPQHFGTGRPTHPACSCSICSFAHSTLEPRQKCTHVIDVIRTFIAEFAQISRVGPDEDRRVKAIDELIHHTQHAWKGVESSEDEQTTQCSLCLESFQDGELVLRLPWCRRAICMPLQTLSELTPLNPRLAPQCPFLPLELRRDMVPLDATQGALVPSLQTKPAPQRRRVRTH